MTKIRALIIDDESSNRNVLRSMVTTLHTGYELIGEAGSAEEGFRLITALKPDLIFLDIKMPEESGFDLLKRFVSPDFEVVFVTGFDEYAIQAFECNALDYILKPINAEKFSKALIRIKTRFDNNLSNIRNLERIIGSYSSEHAFVTKIPVHHNNQVVLLSMEELMYISADNTCTLFVTRNGEEYMSSRKLIEFEFLISRFPHFLKINRGTYVNLDCIRSYTKGPDCSVILSNGITFEVSRRRKTEILAALNSWKG